jgi:hypothetical protein
MMREGRKYLSLQEYQGLSKSQFLNQEGGGVKLSKSNFNEMSLHELRCYVLSHRDDTKAWQEFTDRERPHAIHFDADMPLQEQQVKLQALVQKHGFQ